MLSLTRSLPNSSQPPATCAVLSSAVLCPAWEMRQEGHEDRGNQARCRYCYRVHYTAEEQVERALQAESLSRGTGIFINNYNAINVFGT